MTRAEPALLLPGLDGPVEDPAFALMRAHRGAPVVGLDEVGRGPLAGPVVAAAVVLAPDHGLIALDDSKVLDESTREALVPLIFERALAVGIGVVEAPRIDAINILQASLEAMRVAFEDCGAQLQEAGLGRIVGAIVDGTQKAPLPFDVDQRCVIDGDALSAPVSAASIIAKVTRDLRMMEEAVQYPGYGFEQNKGYPTPKHREALKTLGPTPLHRRSFAPVAAACRARGIA